MKQSPQQRAKLRACASCKWIFNTGIACPKCGFGSYGARYAFGNQCYRWLFTQKPWLDQKMNEAYGKLDKEISDYNRENGICKNKIKLFT